MADFPSTGAGLGTAVAVIPVSLLNRLAREQLEAAFPLCWVAGEVSNLSHASSGHVYFSLKDRAAQVRCVMFRSRAQLLGWRLENGQNIEARVLVTLYEARGDFQLNVEAARRAGIGNLYEEFLRRKEKLEREGLFDSAAKRPLPAFPRRIGIVTSLQAAALRDVLSTLGRRAGQVSIVVYPTPVQGDGAAAQIAAAIRCAGERRECAVLIVCRGGGSIEDLWAFNDEAVARAIRSCSLPVISGIGHETDFTIADFAADQRAPTPTAAAELAAPERAALLARIAASQLALRRHLEQNLNQRGQQLDWLAHRCNARRSTWHATRTICTACNGVSERACCRPARARAAAWRASPVACC
jgi:exodeoxyribonuclease VII large subunit